MREGATLWHPYVRASSRFAYLAGEEISEQIKYSKNSCVF